MPATSGASGPTTVRSACHRLGERNQRRDHRCSARHGRHSRDAGLPGARKSDELPDLRESPGEGVLAAAAADDENLHDESLS